MTTQRVGLLGWPVEHSLSPTMHNAAFAALGIDWRYDLLPAPPDRLEETVSRALSDGYLGFNVTIPHKRAVLTLPQVLEIDPAVEAIGAANTLSLSLESGLRATNTDWRGFQNDLEAHGIGVGGLSCLVLGTGGSARGIAYALAQLGARRVQFVSREPNRSEGEIGYGDLGKAVSDVQLIVNCTPVGMSPQIGGCPWPQDVTLPAAALVYDLIYTPPVTRLMALAGPRALGGLGMLVQQGAASFRQWTGVEPPLEVMEQAARQALAQREAL